MAWMIPRANLVSRLATFQFPRLSAPSLQCNKTSVSNQHFHINTLFNSPRNINSYRCTGAVLCDNALVAQRFHKVFSSSVQKSLFKSKNQFFVSIRTFSNTPRCLSLRGPQKQANRSGVIYILSVFIIMIGASYAAVPLYKVFCQATGLGGQAIRGHDITKVETMEKKNRKIKVRFNADVNSSMRWNFKPQQPDVTVALGETALAFYTAMNPTDTAIIGISTYNVLPYEAALYFNKIQCFCFEEQRLNPGEQVDMPVFFYIDPEYADDPKLEEFDSITLSYTFFEAKDGLQLPLPGYPQPHDPPMPVPQ